MLTKKVTVLSVALMLSATVAPSQAGLWDVYDYAKNTFNSAKKTINKIDGIIDNATQNLKNNIKKAVDFSLDPNRGDKIIRAIGDYTGKQNIAETIIDISNKIDSGIKVVEEVVGNVIKSEIKNIINTTYDDINTAYTNTKEFYGLVNYFYYVF